MPDSWHHWPGIWECSNELSDEFRKHCHALLQQVAIPTGNGYFQSLDYPALVRTSNDMGRDCHGAVRLEPELRDALSGMCYAVMAIAKSTHEKGFEKGRNFLVGLCDGSVSLAELNEATIGQSHE